MTRVKNPPRAGLALYLATLFLVLGIAGTITALDGLSFSTFAATLSTGAIVLGLIWIAVGFLFGSSVNAYVGPGSYVRAPPFVYPGSAIPERSPEVLKDLAGKLSDPQGLSVVFAILGVLILLLGIATYASPLLGFFGVAALAGAVASLLILTRPGPAGTRRMP